MKFFIEAMKESAMSLWRMKVWAIIIGLFITVIIGGGTYIVSQQVGGDVYYNPLNLINHLEAISEVYPDSIRDFILNGYGLLWALLTIAFAMGMIYSCYIFILTLFMHDLMRKEGWVEDCWPDSRRFIKAIILAIFILAITVLLLWALMMILVMVFEMTTIPKEIMVLISIPVIWLYISTYFAINFMVINNLGVIKNIKKSIKMVNSQIVRFLFLGLFISVLLILTPGWLVILVMAYTLTLSSYYTVRSSDIMNSTSQKEI